MQSKTNKNLAIFLLCFLLLAVGSCSNGTPTTPVPANPSAPVLHPTFLPPTVPLPTANPIPTIPAPTPTIQPESLMSIRGVWVNAFLKRGFASGYYPGEFIHDFDVVNPSVGNTAGEEVGLQLGLMKQMGLNTLLFELRASDPTYVPGPFKPPVCNMGPALGLQYPQPTDLEIKNLLRFFDLAQSKGLKIVLVLNNNHVEEQPPTYNQTWIDSIVRAVKDHPALELLIFGGQPRIVGKGPNAFCGLPAEPSLWEGFGSQSANYIEWVFRYAHSIGVPYRKLSVEAIVGNYYAMNGAPGYEGVTGNHIWDPLVVLKQIFDDLAVPDDQRTYAISFDEHRKCDFPFSGLACPQDASPHAWALETIQNVYKVVGTGNGARVIASEFTLGTNIPDNSPKGVGYRLIPYQDWNTELATEDLLWVMQAYGVDGAIFFPWVSDYDYNESNPIYSEAVLKRGNGFAFNPVKDILQKIFPAGPDQKPDMTPAKTPPVFFSASASLATVKNGDRITITVNLGRTHNFVSADLTDLDPALGNALTLVDQGDGTYSGTAVLSMWNSTPNGSRQVKLRAMDLREQTSTSSLLVELNNPAPILDKTPPDDDFTGLALDSEKWTAQTSGGGQVTQNGKLSLSLGSAVSSSDHVSSTWQFTGDFDVQVGFDIRDGWASPAQEHLDGATLGAMIDGKIYHLTRLRSGSEDKFFPYSDAIWINLGKLSDATSGTYRLIRAGSQLFFLYDIGKGWQSVGEVDVPPGPASIYLANASVNVSQAFTTSFDHFHINSGRTNYAPGFEVPAVVLDSHPPDDDFTGNQLDPSRWLTQINGSGRVEQVGRLALTVDDSPATCNVTVSSNWQFSGDFDVQVDFMIGTGWVAPPLEHLDGATMGANINGQVYHLTRLRSDQEDKLFPWSNFVTNIGVGEPTTALSGKYRLLRTGTSLYLVYDIGSGWRKLAEVDVPAGPAGIYLAIGSINASTGFTTYFNNFKINSGLTNYREP